MAGKGNKPVRTCVGCRAAQGKLDLVRIVRTPTGEAHIDRSGKEQGRGAYLCPKQECFDKARGAHRLDAALKVQLSEQSYASLAEDFKVLLRERSAQ